MKKGWIDFHAHILPCADHGSDSIEVSSKQLEMAETAGISCIVATPHFYPDSDSLNKFLIRREEAFSQLSLIAEGRVDILKGAEVQLCEGLNNLPELAKLQIGSSKTILIEMPGPPWTNRLIETLIRIKSDHGLNVILAHVDRYDAKDIQKLFELGLHGQLNAAAFHRILGRAKLLKWIDEGSISALGSDIHGIGEAYRDYSKAMRVLGQRGEIIQDSMNRLVFCDK